MKTLKRTISSVMVLFLLISSALFLMPAKQVNAATLSEATAWMDKIVKAGTTINNRGNQCVAVFNE